MAEEIPARVLAQRAVITQMFKSGVPAMGLYFIGLAVGVFFERPLGISLAAVAGLLLTPFFKKYVAYLREYNNKGFWALRILLVIAVPLNLILFKVNGVPEGLTFGSESFEDAFRAISMFGWGMGGLLGFSYALLKPKD